MAATSRLRSVQKLAQLPRTTASVKDTTRFAHPPYVCARVRDRNWTAPVIEKEGLLEAEPETPPARPPPSTEHKYMNA